MQNNESEFLFGAGMTELITSNFNSAVYLRKILGTPNAANSPEWVYVAFPLNYTEFERRLDRFSRCDVKYWSLRDWVRACNAVGNALQSHWRGREFESHQVHNYSPESIPEPEIQNDGFTLSDKPSKKKRPLTSTSVLEQEKAKAAELESLAAASKERFLTAIQNTFKYSFKK